jgi:DNA-binding CsgD family transcriptional regulator
VNAASKAAARRKQILRLRRRGDTFQEIGDALGVSRQRAHQLWQVGVAEDFGQQLDKAAKR